MSEKKTKTKFQSLKIGYKPKVAGSIYRAIFQSLDEFGILPKYLILGYQVYINLAAWMREKQPVSSYDIQLDYRPSSNEESKKVDEAFDKIDSAIKDTLNSLDLPETERDTLEKSFSPIESFAGVPLIVDPDSRDRVTAIIEPTMLLTAFVAFGCDNSPDFDKKIDQVERNIDHKNHPKEVEEFIHFLKMISDMVDKKEKKENN